MLLCGAAAVAGWQSFLCCESSLPYKFGLEDGGIGIVEKVVAAVQAMVVGFREGFSKFLHALGSCGAGSLGLFLLLGRRCFLQRHGMAAGIVHQVLISIVIHVHIAVIVHGSFDQF